MAIPEYDQWKLHHRMDHYLRRWKWGQRLWSAAYHASVFGAAILSGWVAFLVTQPQGQGFSSPAWESGISIGAGVLTAMSGLGGFKGKWQANRRHRGDLEALRMELDSASRAEIPADKAQLRQRFFALVARHNGEILAAEDAAPSPKHGEPRQPNR
jgi:hypothetical protein